MPFDPKYIQQIIEQGIPGSQVTVEDMVGDGDHLSATVISEQFRGKKLLAQHQIVYGVLKDILKDQLHALKLKTSAPS